MALESIFEKLQAVCADAEIWWDSSPTLYKDWAQGFVESESSPRCESWRGQLARLFNPDSPEKSLLRGVTTNPALISKCVLGQPEQWSYVADQLISEAPYVGAETIFWRLYKQVILTGAQSFLPLWEQSDGRYGWISITSAIN